jgi:hypothetical protein
MTTAGEREREIDRESLNTLLKIVDLGRGGLAHTNTHNSLANHSVERLCLTFGSLRHVQYHIFAAHSILQCQIEHVIAGAILTSRRFSLY